MLRPESVFTSCLTKQPEGNPSTPYWPFCCITPFFIKITLTGRRHFASASQSSRSRVPSINRALSCRVFINAATPEPSQTIAPQPQMFLTLQHWFVAQVSEGEFPLLPAPQPALLELPLRSYLMEGLAVTPVTILGLR